MLRFLVLAIIDIVPGNVTKRGTGLRLWPGWIWTPDERRLSTRVELEVFCRTYRYRTGKKSYR